MNCDVCGRKIIGSFLTGDYFNFRYSCCQDCMYWYEDEVEAFFVRNPGLFRWMTPWNMKDVGCSYEIKLNSL
jgi:hypothetical protein